MQTKNSSGLEVLLVHPASYCLMNESPPWHSALGLPLYPQCSALRMSKSSAQALALLPHVLLDSLVVQGPPDNIPGGNYPASESGSSPLGAVSHTFLRQTISRTLVLAFSGNRSKRANLQLTRRNLGWVFAFSGRQ